MYTVKELISILKEFDQKAKVRLLKDGDDADYKIKCICKDYNEDNGLLIIFSREK